MTSEIAEKQKDPVFTPTSGKSTDMDTAKNITMNVKMLKDMAENKVWGFGVILSLPKNI